MGLRRHLVSVRALRWLAALTLIFAARVTRAQAPSSHASACAQLAQAPSASLSDETRATLARNYLRECLVPSQVIETRGQFERSRSEAAGLREGAQNLSFSGARLNDPGLFQATGITQAARFAAAINTQLSGVEAGVAVAPARFFEGAPACLGGLTFSAAAVANRQMRVGVGFTLEFSRNPQTLHDLFEVGTFSEERLRTDALRLEDAFARSCRVLSVELTSAFQPTADEAQKRGFALAACGLGAPVGSDGPVTRLEHAAVLLQTWGAALRVRALQALAAGSDARSHAWVREVLDPSLEADLAALDRYRPPTPLAHSGAEIREALASFRNRHAVHRLGFNLDADWYERLLGFTPATRPKCTTVPAGMMAPWDTSEPENGLAQWRLRGEYSYRRERVRFTVGAGFMDARTARCEDATPRELRAAPFQLRLEPSFSFAVDLMTPASVRGLLRPENPEQAEAPRIVLGIEASFRANLEPSEPARTFDTVRLTPYVGVQVSSGVGFRLAAPVSGDIVTQRADPDAMLPARTAMQWRVPFFLTTVLKIQ